MKAPKFWNESEKSIISALLIPISVLYRLADKIKRKRGLQKKLPIPVICIGNVVAGGAGKTPVALSIAEFLIAEGWKVHFLSRGYGGRYDGPLQVVLGGHAADDVGDEPLLLAAVAPTWVAKDRASGGMAAYEAGADVIIMDDGFQNSALQKDLSFLVIDGGYGVGNGRILPSGPLRESVSEAFHRADAVTIIGDGADLQFLTEIDLPLFRAKIVPHALQNELVGEKVVAFAGIGRPEKFFNSLRDAGAEIVEAVEFPDHHKFSQDNIIKLVEKAALHGAALVTTRKDFVRLPEDARMMTTVFDIDLVYDKPKKLQKLLIDKLGTRQHA
ncbi:MAG: tetraacyldisaccharide 4'-kinase [Sneathiella sp.]